MPELESEILWQGRCSDEQLVLVREHSVELWKHVKLPAYHALKECLNIRFNPLGPWVEETVFTLAEICLQLCSTTSRDRKNHRLG